MKLLEPIKVGPITLKNRIMFPPMTTGYEERDGSISKQSFNFYKRIAEGGVSYIVLGDVAPVNTVSPTPKLFKDEQIPAYKELADALHEFDCKLGIQIFHPEYDVQALAEMFKKGDMQAARAKLHHDMLHFTDEVTPEALNTILKQMGECVRRAYEAGVDVVEVHGDRLVGALCSTVLNHRTDEYGGSFENRTRFALQVVESIKEHAPHICIDYKLPIITDNPLRGKGGLKIDEAVEFAKKLEEAGVNMIHVGQANHTGNLNDTIPAMGTQPYCFMQSYTQARISEKHIEELGHLITDSLRLIGNRRIVCAGFRLFQIFDLTDDGVSDRGAVYQLVRTLDRLLDGDGEGDLLRLFIGGSCDAVRRSKTRRLVQVFCQFGKQFTFKKGCIGQEEVSFRKNGM